MHSDATKTTFYLSDDLRDRLKAVALQRKKTVTDLLVEGATLVLERYQGAIERKDLERRASEAREQMRRGLYAGAAVQSVDDTVYGTPSRAGRRRRNARVAGNR